MLPAPDDIKYRQGLFSVRVSPNFWRLCCFSELKFFGLKMTLVQLRNTVRLWFGGRCQEATEFCPNYCLRKSGLAESLAGGNSIAAAYGSVTDHVG